ncbi:MAG: two-component system regulatory protein YycI [Bacillota bacterium]|nr:two-component system regulatory protein YycI [Bacillota bacterium]MDW7685234.1 two-component system regulatory protein YycI [Bacillota bacterium]
MDLSRAKTILIIAFLILNLFLGHRLWVSPQALQAGRALTGEDAEVAREQLQEAGFEMIVPVPRQIPRLSLLHVSRVPYNEKSWAHSFFGEDVPGVVTESGSIRYTKGAETVEVAKNGLVTYRSDAGDAMGEDSRQAVERFLKDHRLWHDDLRFDQIIHREEQGESRVRYVQTYQGFPLFFSSVDALVIGGVVSEMTIFRVAPLGFSNNELQVISALDAVTTFLSQEPDFPDKRIADISLGYYSQNYDAERWEIVPVWRIAALDGTVFYINAFTGDAEATGL